MITKDYYKILDLPPSASSNEIKQAFYGKAHKYHPDRNNDDPESVIRFMEIKEAYEILSDPIKKSRYLDDRWLTKSQGKKMQADPDTAAEILRKLYFLERKYTYTSPDQFHPALYLADLETILTSTNLDTINVYDDPAIKKHVVSSVLKSSHNMAYADFPKVISILDSLNPSSETRKLIDIEVHSKKNMYRWNKSRGILLLVITILLCFFFWRISR